MEKIKFPHIFKQVQVLDRLKKHNCASLKFHLYVVKLGISVEGLHLRSIMKIMLMLPYEQKRNSPKYFKLSNFK